MTQKQAIKKHLEGGGAITPLEALHYYGCFRLASRISELKREGMDIVMNLREDYNVPGNDRPKIYAEYHIRRVEK
jgi:hypothetical protein